MEDAWTDARVPVSATHVIQSKPAMSDLSVPDDTKGALLNVADGAQNGKAHDVASQTALAIINLSRAKKQRARMLKMLGTVTGSDGQPKCIRITAQPKLLVGGTLQAHQMQGLQWLIDGRMTGTGQILADDMGLGKTIQVTAYFAQLLEWFVHDHSSDGVAGLLKHSLNATNGMKQPSQGSALSAEVQSALKMYGLGGAPSSPSPCLSSFTADKTVEDAVGASRAACILLGKMKAVQVGIESSLQSLAPAQPHTGEKKKGPWGIDVRPTPGQAQAKAKAPARTPPVLRVSPELNPAAAMVNLACTPAIVCRGSAGPHLVVAPSSTLDNWAQELNKWCPFLATVIFGGEKASRDAVKHSLNEYNVVITSYANLEGGDGLRTLSKIQWATVVVDEAHGAKNAESAKFEGLMSLRVDDGVRAGHRVLLTGTPVQNNLTELITLLRLVMPDLFLIQEDGKLKDDEDVGWDEAEVSREGQRAVQLAGALQREVDALTRRAKREAREREKAAKAVGQDPAAAGGVGSHATGVGSGARGQASPPHTAEEQEGDSSMSVADILSVYVLRRVKEGLKLGLPTKTRHVAWLQLTPAQAGTMHTLVRTLLCLTGGGAQAQEGAGGTATLAQSMLVAISSAYSTLHGGMYAEGEGGSSTGGGQALSVGKGGLQAMLTAVYSGSKALVVPDLCEVLSEEADAPPGSGTAAGKAKSKSKTAAEGVPASLSSTTASASVQLLGSSGAIGRLLMLLRKAAIHPLLLRLRYSNDDVLAMAKACWEEEQEEEEEDEGPSVSPHKAGHKRGSSHSVGAAAKITKDGVREPQVLDVAACASRSGDGVPPPLTSTATDTQQEEQQKQEWVQALATAHAPLPRAQLLAWAGGDKKLASFAASMLTKSDLELHQEFVLHSPVLARRGYNLPMSAYTESNKVQWLHSFLTQLHARGSRMLLFSQFTQALDLMEVILQHWGFTTLTGGATQTAGASSTVPMAGYRYGRIDGSTKVTERQGLIDRWSGDASASVMLLSSKAGGVGINLIAADTVVFLDCDWNPTNDAQAEDRVYRIGQSKPVSIYRLFSAGTIEYHMAAVAEDKTHMASALMKLSERK